MDAWLSLQLGSRLCLRERADVLGTGWKEKRLCCSIGVRSWARPENIIKTVNEVGAAVAPG